MATDDAAESGRSEDQASEPANETTRDSQGIFTGQFEIYRTVTEDDYRAVLKTGLIVLDTSAILDLYRYHAKTREDLLQVLRSLQGRIWVPNHAMCEFFKDRLGVIDNHAKELGQAFNDLSGYGAKLERAVSTWANRVNLPEGRRGEIYENDIAPILASLAALVGKIREMSDDRAFENASDTAQDPVITALNEILAGGIGDPLPEEELQDAKKTARKRIEDKVPPGWKDAGKKDNPEGDYLIWHQTIQEAKRRGIDVLFVTSDLKEDWWHYERGERKGPLPELTIEMRTLAAVRLYMQRPASLLALAGSALDVEVSEESVQDAERVSILDLTASLVERSMRLRPGSPDSSGSGFLRPRAISSRWRYTSNGFDLGSVANLSQRSFSHPSHSIDYEKKQPAFRVGAFVACDELGSDDLTADYLRSQMREVLGQPAMLGFISRLTNDHIEAQWRSQPGRGRITLEADVMSSLSPDIPVASALLLLPEPGLSGYGRTPNGAELYMHFILPVNTSDDGSREPKSGSLTEWYQRFTGALLVPAILAQFIESIGLRLHDEPPAKVAMQIQGRSVNQLGIEELVDFGALEALTPRKHSAQFDGWAVADPKGKSPGSLAKRFLSDLCESVGRTGYDELLARLPD